MYEFSKGVVYNIGDSRRLTTLGKLMREYINSYRPEGYRIYQTVEYMPDGRAYNTYTIFKPSKLNR